MIVAIIYLLAVTLAELVTIFYMPVWGIVCHLLILVALLLHSALGFADKYHYRRLVLSLALVPLVRVISLSMPLVNIPQLWWYPIIYVPLLAAAFLTVRILDYSLADVGLRIRLLPVQLVVALSGFLFGVAEYFILRPEPLIAETYQSMRLSLLPLTSGVVTGVDEH